MKRALGWAAVLLGAMAAAMPVAAQTVSMSGSLGTRALLIIDGTPRTVAVGSTVNGVKLLRVNADEAQVEIAGQRVLLRLGGAQVNLGGANSEGSGSRIVLTANSGGHFIAQGSINGRSVDLMVDTGATLVSLSQAEAERIGLKYKDAPRGMANTANGPVPTHRVTLSSVRVGDVQVYNVDALVVPAQMHHVLLGNSFLTRFQMKRDNDTMTLDRRF